MEKMKKIVAAVTLGVFVTGFAGAATVCARNNTFVGVLRKNVAGTTGASDATEKVWRVDYDYTTISGLAACNEITGTKGVPQTNLITNNIDEGMYCWCKMEPVSAYNMEVGITSYWVFLKEFAGADACASSCASDCMQAMQSDTSFRSAVFEAVW